MVFGYLKSHILQVAAWLAVKDFGIWTVHSCYSMMLHTTYVCECRTMSKHVMA